MFLRMKLASSVDAAAVNNTFLHQVKENEQMSREKWTKSNIGSVYGMMIRLPVVDVPINMNKNEQNQTSFLLFSLCQDC